MRNGIEVCARCESSAIEIRPHPCGSHRPFALVSHSQTTYLTMPPPLVSSRPHLSEWYMDEFGRSSGVHNGSTGLAFDAVLRRNCDAPDHYRRHTPDIGDGLLHARGHGPIESRQNFSHRSRLSSPECRTAGNSTARLHLPLHVRPMPNLQTPHEPSLPNLQPLRQSNGPSLPLDE